MNIRITGEAGQGMHTIGIALCRVFSRSGYCVFANQDYMSRIRGGNNIFQVRVSTDPVYAFRSLSQIIVPLDAASVELHRRHLAPGGVMVADAGRFGVAAGEGLFDVPLYSLAAATGSEIFVNSVACGVIMRLVGLGLDVLNRVLSETFADKGSEIVSKNLAAAHAGFEYTEQRFQGNLYSLGAGGTKPSDDLILVANEAIALGAVKAGCSFYSAYPMTPSSNILQTVARLAQQTGIVVEQAEDEIAAINMAIGASYAGVRSMTGSSGGGFALMVEGVSLAGMTETPVVIAVAQRPAPATGFPTRTAQEDLFMVLYAGHGEFPRVIYAPGTAEEAFELTLKAFDTAEKYQIPAFILSDQVLADSYRNVAPFSAAVSAMRRHIISKEESASVQGYKRYLLTESGVSPRAVPSWINDPVYADSDEHTEDGHITEDAGVRVAMTEKRLYKKMVALVREIVPPVIDKASAAEVLLIGFGSTFGVIKEVSDALAGIGRVHLKQVWPFPKEAVLQAMRGAKKVLTVENNATGQLARLIRQETGVQVGSILKFDGRPFSFDELQQRVEQEREHGSKSV
jgi:2-oxoglutarate ferredoxin oxidoreductase subunit alpha